MRLWNFYFIINLLRLFFKLCMYYFGKFKMKKIHSDSNLGYIHSHLYLPSLQRAESYLGSQLRLYDGEGNKHTEMKDICISK